MSDYLFDPTPISADTLDRVVQFVELTREQIETLLAAARKDWRRMEPAILGTLLERALDSRERKKWGGDYTPRAYGKRLVNLFVIV
jgi:hypothetical protein